MKLEKTLTFVLIATKTSWLFPQLKTDIKNLTDCLELCNWILIYILLLLEGEHRWNPCRHDMPHLSKTSHKNQAHPPPLLLHNEVHWKKTLGYKRIPPTELNSSIGQVMTQISSVVQEYVSSNLTPRALSGLLAGYNFYLDSYYNKKHWITNIKKLIGIIKKIIFLI